MMGDDKLSSIREKLREAFAREGSNPIAAMDRRIRQLNKKPGSAAAELRSLRSLRGALVQVIEEKPLKRRRRATVNTAKKAV
jgi:hypothetical protein